MKGQSPNFYLYFRKFQPGYSYPSDGDTFTELLASSVPELNSCALLLISISSLALLRRKLRDDARRR
jgi:hypothetical protein